ncbi:unnamed protein product [Brachionus calyciflorus]|uniref:Rab-GAP TBC domain-containing protein n=1 Tax=Brachionus calyciflorus TaxID=104777 RepID=A0A814HAK6_9BILA|nr:unnamed protein product [Brachionus calyciflorus]
MILKIDFPVKQKEVTKFHHQIYLDLLRTLPNNVKFSSKYSQGVNQLQEVLQVFCLHNPSIGYCQGMNFIVGISLLFLEPEDAFWCLVVITEKLFLPHYFDSGLVGAQADQQCLKNLIELKLPDLHDHLESLELDLSSITLNWFLAIFIDALPFETMLRIWDCFLLEGSKILFRYSLALLHMHKNTLMENNDTISIFKSLKYSVKFTFDIDGLNKIAFEQLEPFPKRKEIIQKQKNYLRIKLESWKSRRLQKINQDIIEWDSENDEQNFHLKIDCSSFVDGNFVWVCYGGQMEGNVMIGDLEMKKMSVQNIVTESKILSIVAIEEFDLVLMGLLSGNLIGFNSVNKEQLWNLNLKDSILNMLSVKAETNFYRLYCAHSNGKLTYIELDSDKEPSEIFDINVSSSPIEWIELVIDDHEEKYIWLASANTVYVYNERTLLNETKFEVSVNQFDHILMLKHTKNGVLLSIKGSSIIHLYDYNTYKCKLLFDVKLNLRLSIEKDDDFSFSRNRLTCFLSLDNNLIWFGTGDGYLLIYSIEIYEQKKIDKLHKKFSLNTQIFKRIMSRRNFSLATDFNLDYIYHERAKLNVKRRDSSLPDKFLDKNSKKEMKKFKSEFILKDISKHLDVPSENEFKINICNNYDLEYKMDLLTKAKISDQPVRTIMSKKIGDEIAVITCSGNYGEDETVLKWSQKDKNWKNEPFIEMCPITNIPKRPLYAKIEYFQNLKNKKETKKFF